MEQTKQVAEKLKECFLDKNLECDGAGCIGCWKDIVRESIKTLESIQPTILEGQMESEEEQLWLKRLRAYFATNDKTIFEHSAFAFLTEYISRLAKQDKDV